MNNLISIISNVFNINDKYITIILQTILVVVIIKVIVKIMVFLYSKHQKSSKNKFLFNQRLSLAGNIIVLLLLFLVWEPYLKNLITIISFISAGLTIAVREVILNFIAGLVIKVKKPFVLEDRIEINGMKGDVVVINALSFKILEVGDRINGEQSSGLIINIPNSFIFSNALKNYNTAFKYIWDEITIKVPLNADINKTKKELLKVVESNEVIASIPKKMDKAIVDSSTEYRIYYNHLKPVIYSKIIDDYVELSIRFLVHPKKSRFVEDDLWVKILEKNKQKKIKLYEKN